MCAAASAEAHGSFQIRPALARRRYAVGRWLADASAGGARGSVGGIERRGAPTNRAAALARRSALRWRVGAAGSAPGDVEARLRGRAARSTLPASRDWWPAAATTTCPRGASRARSWLVADGSEFVPGDNQAALRAAGFEIACLPGVGQAAFRDDFDGFTALLDRWLRV